MIRACNGERARILGGKRPIGPRLHSMTFECKGLDMATHQVSHVYAVIAFGHRHMMFSRSRNFFCCILGPNVERPNDHSVKIKYSQCKFVRDVYVTPENANTLQMTVIRDAPVRGL